MNFTTECEERKERKCTYILIIEVSFQPQMSRSSVPIGSLNPILHGLFQAGSTRGRGRGTQSARGLFL